MFKVGQKVVCVDAKSRSPRHIRLIENEVYTIRAIMTAEGETGLYLEEVINSIKPSLNIEYGYKLNRFRPIDYTFGEKLAEEIQEEINQENLVNA